MKISLKDIKDDLGGNWWNHIYSSNFGFLTKVADLQDHEAKDGDILIHKEVKSGDRFPSVIYHLISGGKTEQVPNKTVKEALIKKLLEFVRKNKKFPHSCSLAKTFKNGNVQINYKPTQHDSFALKIVPKTHGQDNLEEFFKDLEEATNPMKGVQGSGSGSGSGSGGRAGSEQWEITSSSDSSKKYMVSLGPSGNWSCTCPQFKFRKAECKHIKECKKK